MPTITSDALITAIAFMPGFKLLRSLIGDR
jgi:hypothetical protein